jgi:uncharacterized membrane protein YdbT with pleckstrin-like domain
MKRQSIFLILLLLQVLFICIGCGSSEKSAEPESFAAAAQEAAAVTEEAAVEEAAAPAEASSRAEAAPMEESIELVEDAVGIFEGLEDNHTAIFSFDGAETAFFFEDPAVHDVLFEAVLGSAYTLSYEYSDSTGHVIYKISEH